MLRRSVSSKPKKVRKSHYNKPLHKRNKKMTAPLTEEAKVEYGVKRAPIRRGDKVIVEKGEFRDHIGEVTRVDLKNYRIFLKGATIEKASGQEIHIPIRPWNVSIMELKMDEVRKQTLTRKKEPEEIEEALFEEEPRDEEKTEEPKEIQTGEVTSIEKEGEKLFDVESEGGEKE